MGTVKQGGWASSTWRWAMALLALAIALYAYRYLAQGVTIAPANVATNRFAGVALVFHAGFGATALLLGPLQFFQRLRARWPRWHRRVGTVYVAACLLAAPAGLLLAFGNSSGPIATAGFGLLAIAWFTTTLAAWRYARARDFVRHRRWMIRSYALTFAAVTLRLYLPIAIISHLDMLDAYRAISFLCWVPNLMVAELYLAASGVGALGASPPRPAPAQGPGLT
jgi:uncharacterized membrane protein